MFDIPSKSSEKYFQIKIFKQKLRHLVLTEEAMRVEAEAIPKLALRHPRYKTDNKLCRMQCFYDVV